MGLFARSFRMTLGVSCCVTALYASAAWAQSDKQVNFNITASNLGGALNQLAQQSDRQIVFKTDVAAGKPAKPIHGTYAPDEALAVLLQDTGLSYRLAQDNTYVISAAAEKVDDAPARGGDIPPKNVRVAAQTAASSEAVEQVVVTGTLIRGEAPTGSNLITVSSGDIKEMGATNPRDILEKLPQLANFGATQRPGVTGAQGDTFMPNIRNLGAGATLTLYNGHRAPASGTINTQPDPNAIPAIAIERVELVPDGGSSLYGSDAIGGVVNFITRKSFEGIETNTRYGVADSYHSADLGLLAGHSWGSGNAMFAYEYTENSALSGLVRPDYSLTNLAPYGGPDNRSVACTSPNVTISGVSYAYPGLAPNTKNQCEKARIGDLLWASKRHAAYATVRQAVTDDIELWADANWSDRHSGGHVTPLDITATIPNTNPYFKQVPGTTATSESVSLSAGNYLGNDWFVTRSHNTQTEFTVGVDVKLPFDWAMKVFGNYGQTNVRAPEAASINNANVNAAAASTTTSTALDPFGSGTSAAVIQGIGNWNYITDTNQRLMQGVATFDGPIFTLPGGAVKLAAGAEVRQEKFAANFTNGPAGSGFANVVSTTRDVYSFFGELLVPLIGDGNALPFAKELTLSVSGRYDHYNDFGGAANPKVGLGWVIGSGVKLRANWGTSFHAPALSDLNSIDRKFVATGNPASAAFFGTDPQISGPFDAYIVAGGNPGLKPEKANTSELGIEYAPDYLEGFRASLTYYSVNYKSIVAIPPLANAIFANPAFAQYIIRNPTPAQLAFYSAGLPQVTITPISGTLPLTIFDLRRQNLALRNTDGFDFSLYYTWESSLGSWTVSDVGERISHYTLTAAPGASAADQLVLGIPSWHNRTTLGWDNDDGITASASLNYSGVYTNATTLASGRVQYALPAMITTDLFASYTLPKSLISDTAITVNVQNLFDAKPVIGPAGPRPDVDVVGRLLWFGITKTW